VRAAGCRASPVFAAARRFSCSAARARRRGERRARRRGRQQDVRATEVDKVELAACFRPGDLVRAEVASLGDARSYFLATARNELGVVYAKSVEGAARAARASHAARHALGFRPLRVPGCARCVRPERRGCALESARS